MRYLNCFVQANRILLDTGKITGGQNKKDEIQKNESIIAWDIEILPTGIDVDDFRTAISRDDPCKFEQPKNARMDYDACKGNKRGRGKMKQKKRNGNTNESIPNTRAASDNQVHSEITTIATNLKGQMTKNTHNQLISLVNLRTIPSTIRYTAMDNLPDLIGWKSSSDDGNDDEPGNTYLNSSFGNFDGDDSYDPVIREEDGK